MEKEEKRILFLIYGPHPFHKALAEVLNSEELDIIGYKRNDLEKILLYFIGSLIGKLKSYDTLLCEGNFLIPGLFKFLPFKIFKKNIINISADPNLFYIKIGKINPIKRFFMLKALKNVDLFICVGEMESLLLKEVRQDAKYIVVYPFIEEKRYNDLLKIPLKKSFNHNILFIGNGPDWYCKGLDVLVESFKKVKNFYKDANLYILGSWDERIKRNFLYEGVHFVGFDDIHKYILNCSLYLHLGRGDAFPLGSLETLLGGLPNIVSKYTGSKEVVCDLRKDFVVPLDPPKVAEKVIEYFELPKEEKISLSIRAKELGKRFTKKRMLNDFEEKLKRTYNTIILS